MTVRTLNVEVGPACCHFRYSGERNVIKPTVDDGVYMCSLQQDRWCIAYIPPAITPSETETKSTMVLTLIDNLLRMIPPTDYPDGVVDIQLTDLFVVRTR